MHDSISPGCSADAGPQSTWMQQARLLSLRTVLVEGLLLLVLVALSSSVLGR